MKVALIHIRCTFKGGLETRLFNYMKYFLEKGDEVHLFTSKVHPDIQLDKRVTLHLVNLSRYPKPFRDVFFDWKLKHAFQHASFDFALSLGRTSRQQHALAPNTHIGYLKALHRKPWSPVDWAQIYIDKKTYRCASVLYACSNMIKQEMIKYYQVPEKKIQVLYPPLDAEKFNSHQTKEAARSRLRLEEKKKYALFVSTSHKRKGIDILIDVFKELGDTYHLLIAGSALKQVPKNVTQLGFIQDIQHWYRAVDLTIHPAMYEPFGQIVVESIACGTPVVVSYQVGAKELITNETGKIVHTFETEEWKKAIAAAFHTQYSIPAHFVDQHQLKLEQHMEKMMKYRVK